VKPFHLFANEDESYFHPTRRMKAPTGSSVCLSGSLDVSNVRFVGSDGRSASLIKSGSTGVARVLFQCSSNHVEMS
jgi:hypothetical protein